MLKLKDGYILRQVVGKNVVLPFGEAADLNMMIVLNDTGRTLWQVLLKGAEEVELVNSLIEEYDVDEKTAAASVKRFLEKLRAKELLAE